MLDAKFLGKGSRSFQVIAPAAMQQGKPYTVTVIAQLNGTPIDRYAGTLNWSIANGAGVVTQVGNASFPSGAGTAVIQYDNPAITLAQPELVTFRVTDAGDSFWTGTSNAVTMSALILPNGFLVTAPQFVTAGAAFNVTVTAIGTDSLPNADFNGTVTLTPLGGGTGILSPTSMTLSGGTGTHSVSFDQPAGGFTIVARDENDITKFGVSNPVNILVNDLTFVAVPLSTASVRLSWANPLNSTTFDIYRKTGIGSYALINTSTAPASYFFDSGLSASTTYDYRIDAKNSLGQVIRQGSFTVTTSGCGFTQAAATITTATNWVKASNPYCVTGAVIFSGAAASLTIQPGVQILFSSGAGLTFQNSAFLYAVGSSTDLILFTSNAISPVSTGPNWAGLNLAATATGSNINTTLSGYEVISEVWNSGSKVQYAIMEFAGPAITTNAGLWIEKSMFRRNNGASSGGAIFASYATNVNLVVENSSFEKNQTTTDSGGDIAVVANGTGIVRGSSFTGSKANNAAGSIWCNGAPNSTIAASIFTGTTVANSGAGGAIFMGGSANYYTIRNNTFQTTASGGTNDGAISFGFNGGYGYGTIAANTFNQTNGAQNGAVGINGDQIIVQGNTFLNTYCTQNGNSGALYVAASTTNVTITGNSFKQTSSQSTCNGAAGALKIGGTGNANIIVTSNLFSQSSSVNGAGGAIQIVGPTNNTTVSSNLFDATYTQASAGYGGAIHTTGSNPGLTIAYNNFQNTYTQGTIAYGGAIYVDSDTSTNRNIRYNYFNGSWAKGASALGGAIYVAGTNTNLQVQHNNFNNTRTLAAGMNMNVIATNTAGSFYFDNGSGITNTRNWWGIDLSAYTLCNSVVPASYCATTGTDIVINPAGSAWNLCSVVATDPDCVGKP